MLCSQKAFLLASISLALNYIIEQQGRDIWQERYHWVLLCIKPWLLVIPCPIKVVLWKSRFMQLLGITLYSRFLVSQIVSQRLMKANNWHHKDVLNWHTNQGKRSGQTCLNETLGQHQIQQVMASREQHKALRQTPPWEHPSWQLPPHCQPHLTVPLIKAMKLNDDFASLKLWNTRLACWHTPKNTFGSHTALPPSLSIPILRLTCHVTSNFLYQICKSVRTSSGFLLKHFISLPHLWSLAT